MTDLNMGPIQAETAVWQATQQLEFPLERRAPERAARWPSAGVLIRALLQIYLPGLALLLGIALYSTWSQIDASNFTRDPTAILGASPFLGVLSNLGVLLWSGTAAICLFTHRLRPKGGELQIRPGFFRSAGLLTGLLLVDDLFRFHDFILPFKLGIRQEVSYFLYAVAIVAFLYGYRSALWRSRAFPVLLLALMSFGVSVLLDLVPETWIPWHFLVEDGFKFLGILGWSAYFASTCSSVLRERLGGEWVSGTRPDSSGL